VGGLTAGAQSRAHEVVLPQSTVRHARGGHSASAAGARGAQYFRHANAPCRFIRQNDPSHLLAFRSAACRIVRLGARGLYRETTK